MKNEKDIQVIKDNKARELKAIQKQEKFN